MKTALLILSLFVTPLCIAEQLPAGHPSIQNTLHDSISSRQTGNQTLANEGSVLDVVQTENYTYIEVQQGTEKIWLATAKIATLSKNTVIHYADGIPMKNFYSNTLKREFPMILFVGSVRIEKK